MFYATGPRGFSCAVSGFGQVFIKKGDPLFAARVFGLRPKTGRPAARRLLVALEKKPLVPRVPVGPPLALVPLALVWDGALKSYTKESEENNEGMVNACSVRQRYFAERRVTPNASGLVLAI